MATKIIDGRHIYYHENTRKWHYADTGEPIKGWILTMLGVPDMSHLASIPPTWQESMISKLEDVGAIVVLGRGSTSRMSQVRAAADDGRLFTDPQSGKTYLIPLQ